MKRRSNEVFFTQFFDCQKLDKGTCMWRTKYYGINFAAKVMCPDGKVRMARTHTEPCMFGAIDARVTMANKQTVQGVIVVNESFNCKVYTFHPHAWQLVWSKSINALGCKEQITEWFASEFAAKQRRQKLSGCESVCIYAPGEKP